MTDLAAALDALASSRQPSVACTVGEYLADLAARDAALHARVVAFMGNPSVSHAGLARALEADGAKLTAGTIRRHRMRGTVEGCKCPA